MDVEFEAGWLYHVHLLIELALEKDVLDIHLVEVLPVGCCEHNHSSNGSHLCHWGKCLFIINTMCLRVALCHKSGLVRIESVVGVVLHFEDLQASTCLLVV